MEEASSGQWLQKALGELCKGMETGLDSDMISGLVSYCELAHPLDAKEYLDNIIGQDAGRAVTEEYLRRRGQSDPYGAPVAEPSTQLRAYMKPRSEEVTATVSGAKKPTRAPKVVAASTSASKVSVSGETRNEEGKGGKKKKGGKVVSLTEVSKGSVVFKQGKPCSCQARQHRLVSNCLSCGKIVCEQEGEGPCSFCGTIVLMEGSNYAGLDEGLPALSDAEAVAEAYAKRLVDYDRNSAARTTVIDDQSDYYEIEGNSWLSNEEKELLRNKREEIEQKEKENRNKVVVTFDLVGRKVLINKDEVDELDSECGILRPPDEREPNRIKPNPTLKVQPIFMDPGPMKRTANKNLAKGLCLEITGRVQHEGNGLKYLMTNDQSGTESNDKVWRAPSSSSRGGAVNDDGECLLDYR